VTTRFKTRAAGTGPITADAVAVQPLLSVTVNVYVPGDRLVLVAGLIVYAGEPPPGVSVTLPVTVVQPLGWVAEAPRESAEGEAVIVADTVAVHAFASVTV
jgi:hypothetical protein